MSKRLLDKLETYEQIAYDGGYGDEWLETVGEGFKFYVRDCVGNNKKVTISGFEKYLDTQIRKSNNEFNEDYAKAKEYLKLQ